MIEKKCSRCKQMKIRPDDFYMSLGKWRSECKACTIKRNIAYQKRERPWKSREIDLEQRRTYMNAYYAKNKSKFAVYRATFKQRHPDYFRNYMSERKNDNGNIKNH